MCANNEKRTQGGLSYSIKANSYNGTAQHILFKHKLCNNYTRECAGPRQPFDIIRGTILFWTISNYVYTKYIFFYPYHHCAALAYNTISSRLLVYIVDVESGCDKWHMYFYWSWTGGMLLSFPLYTTTTKNVYTKEAINSIWKYIFLNDWYMSR